MDEKIVKSFEKEYPLPVGSVFKKDHYVIKEKNGNEHFPFFNSEFRQYVSGWEAHKFDPWDTVPKRPVNGERKRRLIVLPAGEWGIVISVGSRHIVVSTIAHGHNADPSQNDETKILENGEWI